MTPLEDVLRDAPPETGPIVAQARAAVEAPTGVGFRALFASVPRRLGSHARAPATWTESVAQARSHWTLTDGVRLWLLREALAQLAVADAAAWLLGLFEAGELGEQVSILRVLAALPDAGRFVETAVAACRHNSGDVFEAVVCENPFLAAYFPELSFNQAVMKAIFLGVSLARVEGLAPRISPELSRMASGYVSERRAAGRDVPADADYLSKYGA